MEHYKELGNKYFRQNKKRNIFTIVCTALVVICIFSILNITFNWVRNYRKDVRGFADYEILITNVDKEKAKEIIDQEFVESGYVGTEITGVKDDREPILEDALHINVKNKLLINYYRDKLTKEYGVNAEVNEDLVWTYGQDIAHEGNIIVLLAVIVSYIITIIGVGYIRNSMQLSAIERIKDYGNLRCIGATKKEIKQIILHEAFMIETIGITIGCVLAFVFSSLISFRRGYPVGFNFLPFIIVFAEFYFDLFFIVRERMKYIINLSPVEALSANIKIKQSRLKKRDSGIWKLLFGIEGDYAYKNLKRNNKRTLKTTLSIMFGLVVIVTVGGLVNGFLKYMKLVNSQFGYYQDYIIPSKYYSYVSFEEIKSYLPSKDNMEVIKNTNGIGEVKYVYDNNILLKQKSDLLKHINKEYLNETRSEFDILRSLDKINDPDAGEWYERVYNLLDFQIYAYDENDFKRNEEYLIDGTLDISENGVILVNYGLCENHNSYYYDGLLPEVKNYTFTDYKVGDEIEIVDPVILRNRIAEEVKVEDQEIGYPDYSQSISNVVEELRAKGYTKKLVIEGIVEKDANIFSDEPKFLTTTDNYFKLFKCNANDYSGFMVHVDNCFNSGLSKLDIDYEGDGEGIDRYYFSSFMSGYFSTVPEIIDNVLKIVSFISVVFIFILINVINSIIITRSNLRIRTNEMAQLRALGMTKKSLYKTVMLEGFIVWFRASLIGIPLGILVQLWLYNNILEYVFYIKFSIAIWAIVLGLVLSALAYIYSNYKYVKNMRLDVAKELSCDSI
ncbi:MAG: ABC transporter permease [Eubacterium sp.]|nr:ABC transporter permease [Eubacterium sp.]